MFLDYAKSRVSKSYVVMDDDVTMSDSDCSEDYDTDPFF